MENMNHALINEFGNKPEKPEKHGSLYDNVYKTAFFLMLAGYIFSAIALYLNTTIASPYHTYIIVNDVNQSNITTQVISLNFKPQNDIQTGYMMQMTQQINASVQGLLRQCLTLSPNATENKVYSLLNDFVKPQNLTYQISSIKVWLDKSCGY